MLPCLFPVPHTLASPSSHKPAPPIPYSSSVHPYICLLYLLWQVGLICTVCMLPRRWSVSKNSYHLSEPLLEIGMPLITEVILTLSSRKLFNPILTLSDNSTFYFPTLSLEMWCWSLAVVIIPQALKEDKHDCCLPCKVYLMSWWFLFLYCCPSLNCRLNYLTIICSTLVILLLLLQCKDYLTPGDGNTS